MNVRRSLLVVVVAGLTVLVVGARNPRTGTIEGMITVSGSVVFEGTAPPVESLDMEADRYCSEAHGGQAVERPILAVGSGGGLKDVVIYIEGGVPSADARPSADEPVLDQEGCLYKPRVVALHTDQTLIIRNSDATLHNVHVRSEANSSFNIGQPIKDIESRRSFAVAEMPIRVTCDVHGWMHGVIVVFDHPFFDVSGDSGRFELPDLPPGEYTIKAWHESLGTVSETVRVEAGSVSTLNLAFTSAEPGL